MMNKYKKAFDELKMKLAFYQVKLNEEQTSQDAVRLATLRELIRKEEPMKPHWIYPYKNNTVDREPFCGRCKKMYLVKTDKYCNECGQAIDWSKEKSDD